MAGRIGKRGISLKVVNIVLIAVALVLCSLMIYSTFHLAAGTSTLTDTTEQQIELRKAAREINRMLGNDDELPSVSISVGITHGIDVSDAKELFERADSALYTAKNKGKHTYSFYTKQ